MAFYSRKKGPMAKKPASPPGGSSLQKRAAWHKQRRRKNSSHVIPFGMRQYIRKASGG